MPKTNPMVRQILRLLLCLLCCSTAIAARAGTEKVPVAVIRTQHDWAQAQNSGQKTPLDALTPYGRRRFVASFHWGREGVAFSFTQLLRELTVEQIAAVLQFLDSSSHLGFASQNMAGTPLRLPEPSPEVEASLLRLEKHALEQWEKRASKVTPIADEAGARLYLALFGERMHATELKRVPSGDLPLLFDAASEASESDAGSPAGAHVLLVYDEMAARGIDTRHFDKQLLQRLLAARHFAQAQAFAATRPHLAAYAIPTAIDALGPAFKGRSVYAVDAGGQSLTRRALPTAPTELVMVVDAGCHFSQDALEALRTDPALLARLRKANLIILTPPRSPVSAAWIGEWNALVPTAQIYAPFHTDDWKSLDVVGVPVFFVLKNGEATARFRGGWPPGGNKAALLAWLDEAI